MQLSVTVERFAIAGGFRISRGAKKAAEVVVVELRDGEHLGRGEAVPYKRYGESPQTVVDAIETAFAAAALSALPPGAARNAVDCATWDLEAQRRGKPVHEQLSLPAPGPLRATRTISVATPTEMAAEAERWDVSVLKLKLAGDGADLERVRAVRTAVPAAELWVDANEAMRPESIEAELRSLASLGVALVEQPLPAGADAVLATFAHPLPICADESVHDRASLVDVDGLYDAVNVKLDKTGGLTEAHALVGAARDRGLKIMIGCMVCSSLAIAPAWLLSAGADWVDLDGSILLANDREHGARLDGGLLHPPSPALWGHPR